jgi:hypothetical protein
VIHPLRNIGRWSKKSHGVTTCPGVTVGIHQIVVAVLVPVDVTAIMPRAVQIVGDVQTAVGAPLAIVLGTASYA